MSSKQLTPAQLKILRHKSNSNVADVNLANLVTSVESGETSKLIKQQITSLGMSHKPRAIITRAEQSTLKTVKIDTSIVIISAEKCCSTVVLAKTDYIQKVKALLKTDSVTPGVITNRWGSY
ncbi:unnamed protein product [Schistocephalus solidus]|uniref:Arginine repressor n=1 Tax=Schistocephalus solidus TaxID=70667 RepID=A0A183TSH0_SCHSO|nr:unnamed protein product [Schistocephalus solidus]